MFNIVAKPCCSEFFKHAVCCFVELLLQADGEDESPLCRKYRDELDQLKDEFERYRLRAQSVLKNKKVRTSKNQTFIFYSLNLNIQ